MLLYDVWQRVGGRDTVLDVANMEQMARQLTSLQATVDLLTERVLILENILPETMLGQLIITRYIFMQLMKLNKPNAVRMFSVLCDLRLWKGEIHSVVLRAPVLLGL
jgi:hypothetical protein